MTLTDLRNDIVTILLQKHYISEEDFGNISFITSEGDNLKNAALKKVLSQLTEANVVQHCPVIKNGEEVGFWILDKSSEQIAQVVELQPTTCALIGTALKQYADFSEMKLDVDVLNLTEREIQILCVGLSSLVDFILNEEESQSEEIDPNLNDIIGNQDE